MLAEFSEHLAQTYAVGDVLPPTARLMKGPGPTARESGPIRLESLACLLEQIPHSRRQLQLGSPDPLSRASMQKGA